MKRSVLCLIALSVLFTHSAQAGPILSYGKGPNACEQELISKVSEKELEQSAQIGIGIAAGSAAGLSTYAILSVADGGSKLLEMSSANLVGEGLILSETPPAKFLLAAVLVGGAVIAIYVGSAYSEYHQYVDTNAAILALLNDVKNNGMGPAIELRSKKIGQTLRGKEENINFARKTKISFNPDTFKEENVTAELVTAVKDLMTDEGTDCSDPKVLSQEIERLTMDRLIRKYNPGALVKFR